LSAGIGYWLPVSVFIILAWYVPNVAKRTIIMTSVYWQPTGDRRPATDRPHILENFKRWPLTLQRVIRSTSCLVLASRVRFSRSADRTALRLAGSFAITCNDLTISVLS